MSIKKTVLFLWLIINVPAGHTSQGSTLRCGRNLVELGDYKNRVADLCGEPESIETNTKIVGSTFHFPRKTIDLQEYQQIQVEEWIYNFGPQRFQQYLRFENGVLVEINDLKKGHR